MKTKERTRTTGQAIMVQRWQPHVLDSDSRNNTSHCLICHGEFLTFDKCMFWASICLLVNTIMNAHLQYYVQNVYTSKHMFW